MPSLKKHQDFQAVRDFKFCYLCGKTFDGHEAVDFDHVPPKTIFAKDDRENPLILKTHKVCNQKNSDLDQIAGDFISVLHETGRRRQKIKKHLMVVGAGKQIVMRGISLKEMVARYIRGFHSALYAEYLPNKTDNAIQVPFPSGVQTEGGIEMQPALPVFSNFSEVLQKNRIARKVDEILCYSGRCHYFCVWSKLNNGQPCCLFALRIYDWEKLADTTQFPRRACLGAYWNVNTPVNATVETNLEIPTVKLDPLDPFQD